MSLSATNVRVGVSGEIFSAPLATTMPTDTSTALNAAFKGHGYVSEDGLVEKPEVGTKDIKAWQGAATVRTVTTDVKWGYEFTLIETKKENVELFYGTTITQTVNHGTYTIPRGGTSGRKAWVIEIIDGVNIKRILVSDGEVFKAAETNYVSEDAVGYPCQLVCYVDPVVYDSALKS